MTIIVGPTPQPPAATHAGLPDLDTSGHPADVIAGLNDAINDVVDPAVATRVPLPAATEPGDVNKVLGLVDDSPLTTDWVNAPSGGGWPLTSDVSAAGFSIYDLGAISQDGGDFNRSSLVWEETFAELILRGGVDNDFIDAYVDDAGYGYLLISNAGESAQTRLGWFDGPGEPYLLLGDAPRLYGTDSTPLNARPGVYLHDGGPASFEVWSGDIETPFSPGAAGVAASSTTTPDDSAILDVWAGPSYAEFTAGDERAAIELYGGGAESSRLVANLDDYYLQLGLAPRLYGTDDDAFNGTPGLVAHTLSGWSGFSVVSGDRELTAPFGIAGMWADTADPYLAVATTDDYSYLTATGQLRLGDAPLLSGTDSTPYQGAAGLWFADDDYAGFEVWAGDTGLAFPYSFVTTHVYTGDPEQVAYAGMSGQVDDTVLGYSYWALQTSPGAWPYLEFGRDGIGEARLNVERDADQWRIPIRDADNAVVGGLGHDADSPNYVLLWGPGVFDIASSPSVWVGDEVYLQGPDGNYLGIGSTGLYFNNGSGIDGTDTPATLGDLMAVLNDLGVIASSVVPANAVGVGRSPDNTLWAVTVDNAGVLSTAVI